ncbi:hypothetical protein, partial [Peterkaempfera bronchialis]|uniref:hypothetical protein n=1 Tax=Peterkaempfera bronchialis TaxID=2126346 RepID=UPI003C2B4776
HSKEPKGFKYLALTFGTLLSSQGTDASIETPSGFSGRFPSSCSSLSDPLGATAFPIPRWKEGPLSATTTTLAVPAPFAESALTGCQIDTARTAPRSFADRSGSLGGDGGREATDPCRSGDSPSAE